jgi:hypothetical protein
LPPGLDHETPRQIAPLGDGVGVGVAHVWNECYIQSHTRQYQSLTIFTNLLRSFHMSAPVKNSLTRLRLSDDEAHYIGQLAGNTMTDSAMATLLMRAAINAVREAGGSFRYPLRFEVGEERHESRAAPPKRKAA